jgi:ABC-type antimicrobial peptide transport system ATPase subunit
MMVKPDQLQLVNLISRKGNSGEVWRGSLWGKAVAIKLLPLVGVDERQLDCLRREVAVLLHTTGECKQVRCGSSLFCMLSGCLCDSAQLAVPSKAVAIWHIAG